MADRLATPLGNESTVLVFEELLVEQDDIRSIGKTVDTLLIEFDLQAFEAYLSSRSEATVAGRTRKVTRIESPVLSPTHVANPTEQSPEAIEAPNRDFP